MKMPWQDTTGLAQAFAILASTLTISLGLCGVNAVLYSSTRFPGSGLASLFMFTGMAETIGIVLSSAGLLILTIVWIVREIVRHFAPPSGEKD
jgi:hypothetical protein